MPAYDASDTPVPPAQFTGFLPQYAPPGLSIRATFLATDGSRPQELVLEWKNDPGTAVLDFALQAIHRMAAPGDVETVVDTPARPDPEEARMQKIIRAGQARTADDPFRGAGNRIMPEDIGPPSAPPDVCYAEGPGHLRRDNHGCTMTPGHDPVEPEGRAHRCACGGIFGTDQEHPPVAGRSEQARRRGDR